ncbi:MAG TPA: hypothetical protein VD997_05735 [Phycisphaerales bacterium]|nr:hypothetical protein [Phycisphaerales bacterium]
MPFIGPTSGVPGPGNVGRGLFRPQGASGKQVKAKDEVVTGADSVELDRAVHGLSSNEQEDAREDHQKGGYTPDGKPTKSDQKPRLDLAG